MSSSTAGADQWRARKGTALNQSAAGISSGRSPFRLRRDIRFHAERVEVIDRISSNSAPLDPSRLFMILNGRIRLEDGTLPDVDRRIAVSEWAVQGKTPNEIALHKEIRIDGGRPTLRILRTA